MGFREPESTITLRFKTGHQYHGLEATVRSISIGEYIAATGMDGGDGDTGSASLERFFRNLVSWNLEDADGKPVPVSEARTRDTRLIRELNNAYVQSLLGVSDDDPLPETSSSGETSLVPAIPMAPLSDSQAS